MQLTGAHLYLDIISQVTSFMAIPVVCGGGDHKKWYNNNIIN